MTSTTDADVGKYVDSDLYETDLGSAVEVWSAPAVVETAGVFVFLTYLTLPVLTAVRAPGGGRLARSTLDGQYERTFLVRLMGLSRDEAWRGGIRNERIRAMAVTQWERHRHLSGMQHEYLVLIGELLALAPLLVRTQAGIDPPAGCRSSYWRYIGKALALWDIDLPAEDAAMAHCRHFVEQHTGLTADTVEMIRTFAGRHPIHVEAAWPVFLERTRMVAGLALKEGTDVDVE